MQDVTTGEISGIVTDEDGEALPGVVINAQDEAVDVQYNAVTRENGRYVIPNARVGGPYKILATMTGFKTGIADNQFVKLGEDLVVNFTLQVQPIQEG